MCVVLGLLDLLFLAFVAVQVGYFFGGSAHVHGITGLTFSEYARHGFWELLAAAALQCFHCCCSSTCCCVLRTRSPAASFPGSQECKSRFSSW